MRRMIVVVLAAAGVWFCSCAYGRDEFAKIEPGKRNVGFQGWFNVDCIHAGQRGVTGMAQVVISQPMAWSWDTCHRLGFTNETDFISMAQMWYRDRYFDVVPKTQAGTGEWKVLEMFPTCHNVLSTYGELEIPDIQCDLEFFFVFKLYVPYFQYVDYSGRKIGVPGCTEEPSYLSTARIDRVSAKYLPSCGSDWFVRLRSGKSGLRSVKVLP